MCGRYASFTAAQDLADDLAIAEVADDARLLPPSWNVAPTDPVRIVVERPPRGDQDGAAAGSVVRSLQVARWGLVPSWAKDPGIGARMINARSETLLDKPAFAKPLAARRCLVPADGYYEWRALDVNGSTKKPVKQAYWIRPVSGPAVFAGLYEFWRDRSRADDDPDRWLVSTTVITTAAAAATAPIHDRMPVILPGAAWDTWLDPDVGAEEAQALLRAADVPLTARPVSRRVGSVRNNDAGLIVEDPDPVDPDPVG